MDGCRRSTGREGPWLECRTRRRSEGAFSISVCLAVEPQLLLLAGLCVRPTMRACAEKWVARATRPPRSATRRASRSRRGLATGRAPGFEGRVPFRPASRRTGQAGRLCHPEWRFHTHSEFTGVESMAHEAAARSMVASGITLWQVAATERVNGCRANCETDALRRSWMVVVDPPDARARG